MNSRFGRRVMVVAMIVGLTFSVLYALSNSPNAPEAANQAEADTAK